MTHLKKLIVAAMAVVTVVALCVPALAFAATRTLTITSPSGIDAGVENTYTVKKVFEAVASDKGISYTLVSGKSAPITATDNLSKFDVDSAGNVGYYTRTSTSAEWTKVEDASALSLNQAMIDAIAAYVKDDTAIATVNITGPSASKTVEVTDGYYFITTTTGTLVNVDSTNPNAAVTDKNTVPSVDKKITGEIVIDEAGKTAIQEVGKDVNYEATVTIGKGFENYTFHDAMTGQTLKGDPIVKVGETTWTANTDYTLTKSGTTGFDIAFKNDGAIKSLEVGDVITITYVGTVNSSALTMDYANNTAYVTYGDENSGNKTPETETKVYYGSADVNKQDGANDNEPMSGAGFKLYKIVNGSKQYYKIDENGVVSWVDTEAAGDERVTGTDGKLNNKFGGLVDGTYYFVETTVPAGYNKAADVEVVVPKKSEGIALVKDIVNNTGSELPSTGGIGTTIFYVIGAILVIGAGVVLITKRRVAAARKDEDLL